MQARSLAAVVVVTTLLSSAVAQVRWTPRFEEAMQLARAESKVVLLAFNLAGERANDELVADHYKDPVLGKLSQFTVNVFCSIATEPRVPGVTAQQQQSAEQQARLQVLKIGPGEDVIAPQHVFVGPDGAVLSAVSYRITKGELEWAWVDAIRKVDPGFQWELSNSARAPGRLSFGAVERGQNGKPPTKEEVVEALKEVRKSRMAAMRNLAEIELLMKSDQPEAIGFVDSTLNGLQANWVAGALDTMGMISPKAYHTVIGGHLSHRDESVRLAAAGALERLAEPKAWAALAKQYKLEKADKVRGRLLRAMASCGPTQKETLTQIDKVMAKEPDAGMRSQALLALAQVDDKPKVHEGLRAALRDPSAKVRSTAAFVLASRRDAEFALTLEEAAAREEELETKAWLEAAAKVVRGGDGAAFKNFLQQVLGEVVPRAGLGGLGGRGAGAGGGRGGGG
ncbi:MAG: hypothetical protein MUC36_01205 [Planctomycetes bacterium]|jgi:HEAT repeat protein|nr:hypothetical protein [Planctomycetota bacterium]